MPALAKDILLIAVVSLITVAAANQTPLRPLVLGEKRLIGSV